MAVNNLEIIDYQPQYAKDFYNLNVEWLKKYFYVEPYDEKVLSNPKKYVLEPGGYIFFAKYNDEIVGVVSLINQKTFFELSKMAVSPKYQGLKIGQKLMDFCIDFAKNKQSIGALKSSVAKVDKKVDQKVGSANTNISGNKKSIASLQASLTNSQKSLEAKMAEVKASVSALPVETEKRIGNNEQSIRSIDATRKKLNSSMAEVESQFNEMKLEIEDIQIRLDRMQNAMTGTL